jgi:phage terminase large subunit-like protein
MQETQFDPEFEKRYVGAVARARAITAELAGPSIAERFARLPASARDLILDELTDIDLARLRYDWGTWARPKQDPKLPPHRIVFWLGGRGAGKTLTGAQRVRRRVEAGARSIALVGPTLRDIERYQIKGDGAADGILTVFPPSRAPEYKAHKAAVFFHHNDCQGCSSAETCGGAIAYVNSAEDPEFRGPNLDTVWCDEPAKWRYLSTIWHNIELATRLRGALPLEIFLTATPLPLQLFRELIADEDTVTILMPQDDNASNLDPGYLARMRRLYDGTRLGKQEREGEILTDNPDALFQSSVLDFHRVESAPHLVEYAIAVDPAIATNPGNDDTGIIGGGRDAAGHIYINVDASSKSKSDIWGDDVIKTGAQNDADVIVVERNRGGDLVAANVRAAKARRSGEMASKSLKIIEVLATKGKAIRAEPAATLTEKGFVHIVGRLPKVETELTEWNPKLGGRSPNRLDAVVMLIWYLARLGDEERPDYRPGFKGLQQASAALRGPPSATASGLAASLPRSAWGSKI